MNGKTARLMRQYRSVTKIPVKYMRRYYLALNGKERHQMKQQMRKVIGNGR